LIEGVFRFNSNWLSGGVNGGSIPCFRDCAGGSNDSPAVVVFAGRLTALSSFGVHGGSGIRKLDRADAADHTRA
uniref:Peptidase S1 domain-containing protein n=1 Tax=Haemonchus placei TaxID=6290 RepID=A0A0N4WXH3_HAEPC